MNQRKIIKRIRKYFNLNDNVNIKIGDVTKPAQREKLITLNISISRN